MADIGEIGGNLTMGLVNLAIQQKQEAFAIQAGVAILDKALESSEEAVLQLLQSMGVGVEVNELA